MAKADENKELDLFFQIWLSEAKPAKGTSIQLLYDAYKSGIDPKLYHEIYVDLPF